MKTILTVFVFILSLTPYALSKVWEVPGECPTIQAGLDSCQVGDTVLVSPGVYYENIIWPEVEGIHLTSVLGQDETIIDGGHQSSVIKIETVLDSSTVIDGFTIQNGGAVEKGGGIFIENSNIKLTNMIIRNNTTLPLDDVGGGGIYCSNSNPRLTNIIISQNSCLVNEGEGRGGGLYCTNSKPTLINVFIIDNITSSTTASGSGAGVFLYNNSNAIFTNVTISGNEAIFASGGGIYCRDSNPILTNVSITGNSSYLGAAGFYLDNSNPELELCTISYNIGTGIVWGYSNPIINECIISNNIGDGIENHFSSSPQIHYSIIKGNSGYGIRNNDPSVIINAEYNWWGDASGPGGYGPGTGDSVSQWVDYAPWLGGISDIQEKLLSEIPMNYILFQNYPNPFNPVTTINYSLPIKSEVELVVYNALGEGVMQLANEEKEAGRYSVEFNATKLPSGIYFYRLQAGSFVETKKMVLLR